MGTDLERYLRESESRHDHLCPRQVLGVRMSLSALEVLRLQAPLTKQSGLVILETDGCFADGIEVASGATIGHRTLRVNDVGKIAATFVDVQSGHAIRLCPRSEARQRARLYAPMEEGRYSAQLQGYQVMPAAELFQIAEVRLTPPLEALLSRPEARCTCALCGEEIINERELIVQGKILCQTCATGGYYASVAVGRAPHAAAKRRLSMPLP